MTPAARLIWVRTYERTGDAGLTCRRYGVLRPTLRKRRRRYQEGSGAAFHDRRRRPRRSPGRKVGQAEEERIITLRRSRKLGLKRLRNELIRLCSLRLSIDTIHKLLRRSGVDRLKRPRLLRKTGGKRYARPIPGDRVRMDVCKIGPGLYQYTESEDCSRQQVLVVFPHDTAPSILPFLDQIDEETPFSIQRIEIDGR